uniref:Small ribosomal subunit protein uS13m n=1 Tax=Chlorokybus atmophyticus TaxID=3144 RepID=A6YEC0_CHLAT|nr:ribosomal protein S13 [Chlorokybus atmophyticus]ABO15117.1 ribosomal protein S13 [Chlorokybus atmophyticus]
MSYNLQIDFYSKKKIRIALRQLFGIGPSLSNQICDQLGFSENTTVDQLSKSQIDRLTRLVNQQYFTGPELRRLISQDIKRFIRIGCYRGFRHNDALPLRGQRTHSNARTCRKRLNRSTYAR